MYEGSETVVRCAVGTTESFKVKFGLHQGSALSLFLLAAIMDRLTNEVRREREEREKTGTNPDLAFASIGPNSRLPDRRVLEKFPRSQHRPSLITPPRFAMAVPSMPVKRWNFRKADWSHYIALTNKFAKTLLPPDSLDVDAAYQDFCNTIKKAAKKTIPRGYRNNYIPCWDAECESLYKTFLQSPQGDDSSLAATALLAKLDRKRRDRWSEAVRSIDFSHSSRKAWSILNNLTGRS